ESKPTLRAQERGLGAVGALHPQFGRYQIVSEGDVPLLFTENETNRQRLFGEANVTPYVKDAFHEHVIAQRRDVVSAEPQGTKAAAHYRGRIAPGEALTIRLRLAKGSPGSKLPSASPKPFDRI